MVVKKTAIEYLVELTEKDNCDPWLAYVIKLFIIRHGNIDDIEKSKLVDYLLKRREIPELKISAPEYSTDSEKVVLRKLIHHSGVAALAEEQKLIFSDQINILYGLNGSGKSSYFKILNTASNNQENNTILKNIYIDSPKDINVNFEYELNDMKNEFNWANEGIIPDLGSIRVFNSEYTNIFLNRRDADNLLIKPYALSYFSSIASLMLELKTKAEEKVKEIEEGVPSIDFSKISEELQNLINKDVFLKEDIKKLEQYIDFSPVERKHLNDIIDSIRDLNNNNPKDSILLMEGDERRLKILNNFLNKLNTEEIEVESLLVEKDTLLKKNIKARKQFEILDNIPGVESEVWNNFVKAGIEYSEANEISDECPYCHRQYDETSLKFIIAYSKYIKDTSQTELEEVNQKIEYKKNELSSITSLNMDEYKERYPFIELITKYIEDKKNYLIEKLNNQSNIKNPRQAPHLEESLNESIKKVEKRKNELKSSLLKRDVLLKEYYDEKVKLEEKESLNSQILDLDKIIFLKNIIYYEKKMINGINPIILSTVSKKAHNDLLTDNLFNLFQENLKKLGLMNMPIKLLSSNRKGSQQTELIIEGNKNVRNILSEGEQKATALALFLSEIELSNNKSTIIFDDPVNSLDNRLMYNFSEILLNLENQIIIFTHNKMFLDTFEISKKGHLCKNLTLNGCNNSKGKHIFCYEILSEGKSRKGTITFRQSENLKGYIHQMELLLMSSPFTNDNKELVCAKLRKAVEFAIDEIILNRQVPTKYSNKNSRINWEELKNLVNKPEIIDKLHYIHGRTSGGSLHNGTEFEENPIDKEELCELLNDIKTLQSM